MTSDILQQNRPIKSAFVRKAYASKGDDCTLSRWVKVPHGERVFKSIPKTKWLFDPSKSRPARSIFWRKGVKKPSELKNLLVSGHSNVKIGRDVRKGLFRGYWIYTLTFEERATCPTTCRHWISCYGNNMPWAKRVDHEEDGFMARLAREVQGLCWPKARNVKRTGVLVRLHALGDFYSPRYVQLWGYLLGKYPMLAAYGYTAWPPDSPIGREIAKLKHRFGRRFAVRWSDGTGERDCTVSLIGDKAMPADAFQCPEQAPGFTVKGKPILCATCGLCWSTDKNVAFKEH